MVNHRISHTAFNGSSLLLLVATNIMLVSDIHLSYILNNFIELGIILQVVLKPMLHPAFSASEICLPTPLSTNQKPFIKL